MSGTCCTQGGAVYALQGLLLQTLRASAQSFMADSSSPRAGWLLTCCPPKLPESTPQSHLRWPAITYKMRMIKVCGRKSRLIRDSCTGVALQVMPQAGLCCGPSTSCHTPLR